MPNPQDISPSPQWKTYASDPTDDDAIKLSIATSTSAVSYSGVALDGAIGAGAIRFPQRIILTTGAHNGTYKTGASNAFTITGTDEAGNVITDTIAPTATNGGEVLPTAKGFASVTKIEGPGQNDALGTLKFGVEDIVCKPAAREVRAGAAGNLVLVDEAGHSDTTPFLQGEHQAVNASRFDVSGCTFPFTIYR